MAVGKQRTPALALEVIPLDDLQVDWEHVYLLGWYIRDGFQRGWHVPGCQKVHPLGETPCW